MISLRNFDFSPAAIRASVEKSLRRLRSDYLDVLLLHSDGNDLDILDHSGAVDCLAALKEEGKIRAHGISTKTVEYHKYRIMERLGVQTTAELIQWLVKQEGVQP